MSYYQGDYYRGDPGFFSFLGGLGKAAAGFIPGVGPSISTALSKIGGSGLARTGIGSMARAGLGKMGRAVVKHPVLSAAGAAGALAGGAGVAGYKMGRRHPFLGRKRRRMNVCNVHALRRSIRRCHGFSVLAKRVLRFTSPRPPKGRMTFKTRARKRKV